MLVRIKETQQIESLEVIDPKTNLNWFADFASVGSNDDFIHFNDVVDPYEYTGPDFDYEVDQANYDWWNRVSSEYEAMDFRLHDLREEYGDDAIDEVIADTGNCDLEDYAPAINNVLDEFEQEQDNRRQIE